MAPSFAFRSAVTDDPAGGILPAQWIDLHAVPVEQGARALAVAILTEAWLTAIRKVVPLRVGHARGRSARREHRLRHLHQMEAREWFFAESVAPFFFSLFVPPLVP
jgi:hypothetical protein